MSKTETQEKEIVDELYKYIEGKKLKEEGEALTKKMDTLKFKTQAIKISSNYPEFYNILCDLLKYNNKVLDYVDEANN